MSVVYWIHLEIHKDILKEGYVGIANDFEARLKSHIKNTSIGKSHFGRAIRLYGWLNLIKEVVYQGNREECFNKEKLLRPNSAIGWNEAIGGSDTSHNIDYNKIAHKGWSYNRNGNKNPFYNKKHSQETINRQNISQSKSIITMPDGEIVYGFTALGRKLKVHKITAKRTALLQGWKIENKPKGIKVN